MTVVAALLLSPPQSLGDSPKGVYLSHRSVQGVSKRVLAARLPLNRCVVLRVPVLPPYGCLRVRVWPVLSRRRFNQLSAFSLLGFQLPLAS
jgi:hypothetical protein